MGEPTALADSTSSLKWSTCSPSTWGSRQRWPIQHPLSNGALAVQVHGGADSAGRFNILSQMEHLQSKYMGEPTALADSTSSLKWSTCSPSTWAQVMPILPSLSGQLISTGTHLPA